MGIVLGFISTILLYPHILRVDQYGLTRLLFSLAVVCAQFAHLGINNVVIRYFPYFKDSENSRNRLLTLAVVVPAVGFLLFTAVYLLFSDLFIEYYNDRSALFSEYYLYLIPLVFAVLFFEALNSYVRALQDSVTGSFINEVLVRILIILLLIAFYYNLLSFTDFMIGFVLAYSIQPVYLLFYLYLRNELSFKIPFKKNSRRFLKGMGVYGAYSLLGGLATLLIGNIDIIMLSAMTDLDNAAVYAIAFYVASVIAVPQRSIVKIATPILADLLKNNKYEQIDSLYKRTSLNQIIAGSLIYIGIWANMHNLLDLLPPEYSGAHWVIIVIGAAKLFNMATGINGSIIINSKYFRFDLYTNILLVFLTVTTNYFLIQIWGMLGAAVATAVSIFIYNFVKFIFVWIKFSMQPFEWNALFVLLIAAGCLGLSFLIPYQFNFFIDITVRSLAIASVFLGLTLLFNLSDDLKNLVSETLRRIRHFLKS